MSGAPGPTAAGRDWGSDEVGCSILHVDMDAFVASVELARRPQLRGLPVIVGGASSGAVVAATYEARAFGVHAAMSMTAALRRCPQAVVVPPDPDGYLEVSAGVLRLLGDVTPLVEPVAIDQAFLDVAGARRRLGPPTVIAALVRRRVREHYGITCSIGIGSTKGVAVLASGQAKPDGVLLVPRRATVDFLRSLPVGALWGVGERTEATLARWGIRTVAELADADVGTVQQAVGRIAGARLVDLSWGRDPRPVVPHRTERWIGAEDTFAAEVEDLTLVQERAHDLADRCAVRLRTSGLAARTVTVQVRTADRRTLTRSRTLPTPTDEGRELYLAARALIAGIDLAGLPVRQVGVRADGLCAVAGTVRRPTWEEAAGEPPRGRPQTDPAPEPVRARVRGSVVVAGTTQVGGVPSRSTTTFVPADLS